MGIKEQFNKLHKEARDAKLYAENLRQILVSLLDSKTKLSKRDRVRILTALDASPEEAGAELRATLAYELQNYLRVYQYNGIANFIAKVDPLRADHRVQVPEPELLRLWKAKRGAPPKRSS